MLKDAEIPEGEVYLVSSFGVVNSRKISDCRFVSFLSLLLSSDNMPEYLGFSNDYYTFHDQLLFHDVEIKFPDKTRDRPSLEKKYRNEMTEI